MAAAAAVVCLFRQAIEQTRYRKKVDRCCNGKRDHPSERHSPVRQFREPTRHTPSHNATLRQPRPRLPSSSAFPTSLNMVNAENGKQEAQKRAIDENGICGVRAAPRRPSEMMPIAYFFSGGRIS
jgi:hypothetical protein